MKAKAKRSTAAQIAGISRVALAVPAKVEVAFINAMGADAKTTGFIESRPELQVIGSGK